MQITEVRIKLMDEPGERLKAFCSITFDDAFVVRDLKISDDDKNRWYRHWVETGLEVVERQLAARPGTYCHGDTPTLADCVLVPQIFNARRFDCRLEHVPQVMRVFDACMKLDAFGKTRPELCPDAE